MGINKLAIFLLLSSYSIGLHAQKDVSLKETDIITHVFRFDVNARQIDFNSGSNAQITRTLDSIIYYYHRVHSIQSIDITAYTSIDGTAEPTNRNLSAARAESVRNYLFLTFPFLRQTPLNVKIGGEDWADFKRSVTADKNVPHREQVLKIINNALRYDDKEILIKLLDGGKTWTYLLRHILPAQRRTTLQLIIRRKTSSDSKYSIPYITNSPRLNSTLTLATPEITYGEPVETLLAAPRRFMKVKTNLLYLAAGVSNLGIEYPIGRHFSIDVPVTFSPYTMKRDWLIRTLSIQPEFRWWTGAQMSGHFFGLHAHAAYYNLSLNDYDRYQDRDGDTPLWGAGVSYGYALPICKRWHLEFTVGAGYARLDYDTFYNVNNGAKYASEAKGYWGITRAGITLSYNIGLKR
ncbi:MAG: DUF3575 domain-containing protein [Prevotellaceae bacterium]|jgi:hypothetical protein|nr:DUF3575 domain-containing protein [Prevotellaceae bacterium]